MTNPLESPNESKIQLNDKLSISPMGCGTWAWGNQVLWGYNQEMDRSLQEVFDYCLNQGVTLFDTGDSYGTGKLQGQSEKLLGKFYQDYKGNAKEDICIATKLAAYPWRLSANSMIAACEASASRLGKPVDLVQMHWSTANYAPWQEKPLLQGLGKLYNQGLVKAVGLSNYGPLRLKKVHQILSEMGVPIATLQIQYSLLSTYPLTDLGVKEICDELGIKIIAYSPLTLGILTGKYGPNTPLPKGLRGFLFRQLLPKIQPLLDCMGAIASSRNKTMSQVALNWCICKDTIPIPGAKNLTQAIENIGALGWRLSAAEVAELDLAATRVGKKMIQNIFQTK